MPMDFHEERLRGEPLAIKVQEHFKTTQLLTIMALFAKVPESPPPQMVGSVTAYCIPSFFIMIGGEIALGWLNNDLSKAYRINNTVSSISLGAVQMLFGDLIAPFVVSQYAKVYAHRLFNIPNTWTSQFGTMILADFLYYWMHRFSHQMNFMWAAHSIHHSGENFNLSTALRQSALQPFVGLWVSLLPAALLGIPWDIYLFHRSLNTVSQFWIHTQYCKDLGPLEYIFNTPAQHIIHHSRAPGECNKNYAGWFSIWDQMFGTFELGHRPRKFGVIDTLYTWDPLVINAKRYYQFLDRMKKKQGIKNKIKWFFGSYRFVTDDGIKDGEELAKVIRYNPRLSAKENIYCSVVFTISIIEFVSHLVKMKGGSYKDKFLSTVYLMLSMSSLNQFMNKSKIGKITEQIRWMIMLCAIGCDRLIGMDKVPMLFDADNWNIAKVLRCNCGILMNGLKNSYKSMAGLLTVAFAGWSWKNGLFRLDTEKKEENEDKKL